MASAILLGAISALLQAQERAPPPPLPDTAADLHFHAPDEIVPAVLPYLACLYASRGLPLLNGTDRQAIASKVAPGADCSGVRRIAEQNAIGLLASTSASGRSPKSVVAETLSSMDSYVAALSAQRSAANWGDLPAVSGSMVMIEDEVLPAYRKYNDCLRSKTLDSPVTSANVLGKFRQARPACADSRAAAVDEATSALAVKGWDLARRQKTAETTFRKADESWTSLGLRLYQALLKRKGKPPANGKRRVRRRT